MLIFVCSKCGSRIESEELPVTCPECGVSSWLVQEVKTSLGRAGEVLNKDVSATEKGPQQLALI